MYLPLHASLTEAAFLFVPTFLSWNIGFTLSAYLVAYSNTISCVWLTNIWFFVKLHDILRLITSDVIIQ